MIGEGRRFARSRWRRVGARSAQRQQAVQRVVMRARRCGARARTRYARSRRVFLRGRAVYAEMRGVVAANPGKGAESGGGEVVVEATSNALLR